MRISVLPLHTAGHFIRETVASVLTQTHSATGMIVVDDGSTDNLAARLA